MKVVLLSTCQLSPAYFDTVRADLGGRPEVGLDVVAWVPPAGPVDGLVESFTLIGPDKMPVQTQPPAEPADTAGEPAEAPSEVLAAEAVEEPKPEAPKPRPTGSKRVVRAVQWRYRRLSRAGGKVLPKSIQKAAPLRKLKANRRRNDLSKNYWTRVQSRPDVMKVVDQADVVIALDAGSIWAGWQLGQRKTDTPVVLGIPAARRELDRLVGAGNG